MLSSCSKRKGGLALKTQCLRAPRETERDKKKRRRRGGQWCLPYLAARKRVVHAPPGPTDIRVES
jgi:hypothetical protein